MKERYAYNYQVIDGKVIREHRRMMEEKIGRKLSSNEIVHHVNGVKSDNSPENLIVVSRAEHTKHHRSVCKYELLTCDNCGKQFQRSLRRIKMSLKYKCTKTFCDKKCEREALYDKSIDPIIKNELNNGLTGYAIAKKYNWNRTTVYNHINSEFFN